MYIGKHINIDSIEERFNDEMKALFNLFDEEVAVGKLENIKPYCEFVEELRIERANLVNFIKKSNKIAAILGFDRKYELIK